jgi:hypothetical protein
MRFPLEWKIICDASILFSMRCAGKLVHAAGKSPNMHVDCRASLGEREVLGLCHVVKSCL